MIRFTYLEFKCILFLFLIVIFHFQAEEACEVHVGPRRGHDDHRRKTSLLWNIQGLMLPSAGQAHQEEPLQRLLPDLSSMTCFLKTHFLKKLL